MRSARGVIVWGIMLIWMAMVGRVSGGGRGGQADLCHVARVRIPAVCDGAHVAPHLVAKNAFAATDV